MATIPGQAPPGTLDDDLPSFFTEQATSGPSTPVNDLPPQAPPGGYATSKAPNPLRYASSGASPLGALGETLAPALQYHLHVQATSNNTITTLTDEKGNPVATYSGGSCGFKGVNRSGYEAGYQCAVRAFRRVEEVVTTTKTPIQVELILKGFGRGREAFVNALTMTEGERVRDLVTRLTDRTPIKIGGTRSKKTRRL